MARSPLLPVSLGGLVRRTVRETIDDDCAGLAAQLSYYFFLALFPAMLFLLALASFFPLHTLIDDLTGTIGPFVSGEVVELIRDQMVRLSEADSGGLLTLGVFGALWSSSAAIVSILSALNRAYDIEETRAWWKIRLLAMGLTIGVALLILVALTLTIAGGPAARAIGHAVGLGRSFEIAWMLVQWPLIFAMVSTAIGLIYYYAPDAEQDWVWITPGAIFATLLWLVGSWGFKYYAAHFTSYNESYGAIGAVIVVMLWLYVSGFAILVGAELNSEIDYALADQRGESTTTNEGKRVIGRRAERLYRERQRPAPDSQPAAAR